MTEANSRAIFAHAMWRSGSTYLASRFAASERYLMFYEPCHEGVGRKPSAARSHDRSRDRQLNHPEIEGGYFGSYELLEPASGRPLSHFHAPDISVRNVYNTASGATIAYLSALIRTANAREKIAFLGFCRSGTQTGSAATAMGGRSLHLWRAPREQFASYGWPANDYFMAGTLLQLAFSPRYSVLARDLVPGALSAPALVLARLLPDRQTRSRYRLARHIAARLTAEQGYALFYLSWFISYRAGSSCSEMSFSLTELANDSALREQIEQEFGVELRDLRPTPGGFVDGIDYDRIEADVAALVNALSGVPYSASV